MRYLSADVGGTFTDLVLIDNERGLTFVGKLPSAERGTAGSIAKGIAHIADKAGLAPAEIDLFVHGFTVATKGCRDPPEIGTQQRPQLYALRQQKPAPIVPRSRVVEVAERLDAFGQVAEPLSEGEVARGTPEVAGV